MSKTSITFVSRCLEVSTKEGGRAMHRQSGCVKCYKRIVLRVLRAHKQSHPTLVLLGDYKEKRLWPREI